MKKVIKVSQKVTISLIALFIYFNVARVMYLVCVENVVNWSSAIAFLTFVGFVSFLIYLSATLLISEIKS